MAINREYTPQRRLVMTGVMWLILAGTVGLAAWASRYPAERPALDPDTELMLRELERRSPRSLPR